MSDSVQLAVIDGELVAGVEPWVCELVAVVDDPTVVDDPLVAWDPLLLVGFEDPLIPQAASEPTAARAAS